MQNALWPEMRKKSPLEPLAATALAAGLLAACSSSNGPIRTPAADAPVAHQGPDLIVEYQRADGYEWLFEFTSETEGQLSEGAVDVSLPVRACAIDGRLGKCIDFARLTFAVPADLKGRDEWRVGNVRFVTHNGASSGIIDITAWAVGDGRRLATFQYEPGRGLISFSYMRQEDDGSWKMGLPYRLRSKFGLLP